MRARVLRIYSALLVSVFVVGLPVTPLPAGDYLGNTQSWGFLLRNMTLFFGASERLPGVFADLPYANAVNGSLSTLPVEIRLYLSLLLLLLLLLWWLASRLGPAAIPGWGW